MATRKRTSELIFNLQWRNKPDNGGDKSNVIGMYDTPTTTSNFEMFKSYLLKNSGVAGNDVKVTYLTDDGQEWVIDSQEWFEVALSAFRLKARLGEVIYLKVDKISRRQMSRKHSNDVETQFDLDSMGSCAGAPPEWFVSYMNQFGQDPKIRNKAEKIMTTMGKIDDEKMTVSLDDGTPEVTEGPSPKKQKLNIKIETGEKARKIVISHGASQNQRPFTIPIPEKTKALVLSTDNSVIEIPLAETQNDSSDVKDLTQGVEKMDIADTAPTDQHQKHKDSKYEEDMFWNPITRVFDYHPRLINWASYPPQNEMSLNTAQVSHPGASTWGPVNLEKEKTKTKEGETPKPSTSRYHNSPRIYIPEGQPAEIISIPNKTKAAVFPHGVQQFPRPCYSYDDWLKFQTFLHSPLGSASSKEHLKAKETENPNPKSNEAERNTGPKPEWTLEYLQKLATVEKMSPSMILDYVLKQKGYVTHKIFEFLQELEKSLNGSDNPNPSPFPFSGCQSAPSGKSHLQTFLQPPPVPRCGPLPPPGLYPDESHLLTSLQLLPFSHLGPLPSPGLWPVQHPDPFETQITPENLSRAPPKLIPETLDNGAANITAPIAPQPKTSDTLANLTSVDAGCSPIEILESPRGQNLCILADMGFFNVDLNVALLARYNDDMDQVVAELLHDKI